MSTLVSLLSFQVRAYCLAVLAIGPSFIGAAEVRPDVCPTLDAGRNISFALSSRRTICFRTVVDEGQGARISATQPIDLVLRTTRRGGTPITADSFEFGPETLALDGPGEYIVEVFPAINRKFAAVNVVMSREWLPLQKAKEIRRAEEESTAAKRLGAAEGFERSLSLWEALGDNLAVARMHLMAGDAKLSSGDLAGARRSYERGLKMCLALSDLRCAAEAENNSGFVSQQLGDFEGSLSRLKSASADWDRIGEHTMQALTLSNLGLLYRQTGDYQEAIGLYEEAGRILATREPLANARVLNNLGLCHQLLGEYGKARGLFDRAIAIETPAPNGRKDALQARINLGRNYFLSGDPWTARSVLNSALHDAEAGRDERDGATALNNLGQTMIALRRPAEGERLFGQALAIHQKEHDARMEASDLHFLGTIAAESGRSEEARPLLERAVQLRRESLLRDVAADSLYELAKLERDAGNPGAARGYAEQALSLLESIRVNVPGPAMRASFFSQKRRFFDLLLDTVVTSDDPRAAEEGLVTAERGRSRALLDLLADGQAEDLLPPDLMKRHASLQRRIDLMAARIGAGADNRQLREQAELLLAEDEDIEAEFRQNADSLRLGGPSETVERLRQDLPMDCALIEFHLGVDRSYVWLVRKNGVRMFRLPPRNVVDSQAGDLIRLYRDVLGRRRLQSQRAAFERKAKALAHTLFGQIPISTLPPRLIVVPDGSLFRLPFAALPLSQSSEPLGVRFDLMLMPAAAYLEAGRAPRAISEFPRTMLAIADPVFSETDPRVVRGRNLPAPPAVSADVRPNLPRLPFSAELDEAEKWISAPRRQFLRGFEANAVRLSQTRLEDFAILHFSTHAFIDEKTPELSWVALSLVDRSGSPVDGLLRPYRLSKFHLDGSTVVLSACDTGLGKEVPGEGLAGFTAGLLHAGAARIVLTLEDVDAEASSVYLKEVYRELFSDSKPSLEHALTLARRSLRRSVRWSDPFYWASFALYGRPEQATAAAAGGPAL